MSLTQIISFTRNNTGYRNQLIMGLIQRQGKNILANGKICLMGSKWSSKWFLPKNKYAGCEQQTEPGFSSFATACGQHAWKYSSSSFFLSFKSSTTWPQVLNTATSPVMAQGSCETHQTPATAECLIISQPGRNKTIKKWWQQSVHLLTLGCLYRNKFLAQRVCFCCDLGCLQFGLNGCAWFRMPSGGHVSIGILGLKYIKMRPLACA